jgi:hypothetical protein
MSSFGIKNLWELSQDELTEYVEARLKGKLFKEKPVAPVFNTYLDEIPEDFLENAYNLDEEGTFKERLSEVVKKLLTYKSINHNAEDSADREYVSRLIYLAEVLDLKSVFHIIHGFAQCTEYMEKSGAHTPDIYTQFLRALAQLQPPEDLVRFWSNRFHDDDYIRYAQPLFTGLRRSSYKDATLALPRLFFLAEKYKKQKYLDPNRALRPFVKYLDGKAEKEVIQSFISLPLKAEKLMTSISNLDGDLQEPLIRLIKESISPIQRKQKKTIHILDAAQTQRDEIEKVTRYRERQAMRRIHSKNQNWGTEVQINDFETCRDY